MDSKPEAGRLKPLSDLARQLRLRQPYLPRTDPSDSPIASGTESDTRKKSAVLICIFQGDNAELRVILTKRSSALSSHPGEVALPGGKMEQGDRDEVATALREAKEEIGLDASLVDIVSVLEPFTMKSGMTVAPVLCLLHDRTAYQPTLNVAEVEAIFDAPLEMFLKDENRRQVEREWMGAKYLLHYFDYEFEETKYVIFALTAGILIEAASIVYQRSPGFTEMKPNFWNSTGNNKL